MILHCSTSPKCHCAAK